MAETHELGSTSQSPRLGADLPQQSLKPVQNQRAARNKNRGRKAPVLLRMMLLFAVFLSPQFPLWRCWIVPIPNAARDRNINEILIDRTVCLVRSIVHSFSNSFRFLFEKGTWVRSRKDKAPTSPIPVPYFLHLYRPLSEKFELCGNCVGIVLNLLLFCG